MFIQEQRTGKVTFNKQVEALMVVKSNEIDNNQRKLVMKKNEPFDKSLTVLDNMREYTINHRVRSILMFSYLVRLVAFHNTQTFEHRKACHAFYSSTEA